MTGSPDEQVCERRGSTSVQEIDEHQLLLPNGTEPPLYRAISVSVRLQVLGKYQILRCNISVIVKQSICRPTMLI